MFFSRVLLFLLITFVIVQSSAQQILVQSGDSLWSIAQKFDTDIETLMAVNELSTAEIMPGMSLTIPGDQGDVQTDLFEQAMEISVETGDNLWLIARRYDTTVDALQIVNDLTSADLMPGMTLKVPGSITIEQNVAVEPDVAIEQNVAEQPKNTIETEIAVQPGDSLWAIAQRYETTVEALQQANATIGSDLMPGMVLVLPTGSLIKPESYVVQEGDTLFDIAVAFNLSVDDLIAFNQLDGSLINVGQELLLTSDSPPDNLKVVVSEGDSLWTLAREYGSNVYDLRAANNISGSFLTPGQEIIIPGRYASTTTADVGGPAPEVITITKGDSLWTLARRYNTTVQVLMSTNGLNSTDVQAGQELKIVAGSDIIRASTAPAPTVVAPSASPSTNAGKTPMQPESTADVMVWPLRGLITSRFGYRQFPAGFHYGLDIDGETGDPIVAAKAGTVTFSGWRGSYGNLVVIESGNTEYRYAHCSELLVQVGDHVAAGEIIGRVGTTGKVTGSHLHFEIHVNGEAVDPQVVLNAQAR